MHREHTTDEDEGRENRRRRTNTNKNNRKNNAKVGNLARERGDTNIADSSIELEETEGQNKMQHVGQLVCKET